MKDIFSKPEFGISITIFAFILGNYIYGKFKTPILNPLLIGTLFIIFVLKLFNIPYEDYSKGGNYLLLFLAPSIILLAVPLYNRYELLKKEFRAIFIGCFTGSIVSISYVFFMCKIFKFDKTLFVSLLPKSVTTPIALEISKLNNGISAVTVASVVITGITGAVLLETVLKIFKIKNRIAAGVAIGTASHAVGTTKAVEIGEIEGAMSSLSIAIAGIVTVITAPIAVFLYSIF